MNKLRIGDLTIETPIIQGGMGVISAEEANKTALRNEIRKARFNSNGVIGVNIMMAVSDFEDLLRVALEEKIDVIFIGNYFCKIYPKGFFSQGCKDYLSALVGEI